MVRANTSVAGLLIGTGGKLLRDMEEKTKKTIVIQGHDDFHVDNVFMEEMWDEELMAGSISEKTGERTEVEIEERHAVDPEEAY